MVLLFEDSNIQIITNEAIPPAEMVPYQKYRIVTGLLVMFKQNPVEMLF